MNWLPSKSPTMAWRYPLAERMVRGDTMKVVILAGGLGTRLGEETGVRPKPMIEIGGMPLLLHIMKIYSAQGFNEFVICLGYLGYVIKEYFANFSLHLSDVTFDLRSGKTEYFNRADM